MSQPNPAQFSTALTWVGLTLLAYLVFLVVRPFLIPLGWGCVIAVMLYPAFARLAVKMGRGRAAVVATLAASILLIAPAVALTNAFASEMVGIAQTLQDAFSGGGSSPFNQMWQGVIDRIPAAARIDVSAVGSSALRSTAAFLMSQSGAIVTNIAVFFVDLALALFATFFLLRDGDAIMHGVRRLLPMAPATREVFIQRTADLIAAGVTSSVIVASLQGALGGIAFALLGLSAPVFWGVVMALACLLPFGAGVVWLPAAIYLIATGSVTKGVVLIAIGAGLVGMVDNVLRPLLLSERVHMNGLVIFVSLLGGLNVFGLLGIVLGPIVVVTALALVQSYVSTVPNDAGATDSHSA